MVGTKLFYGQYDIDDEINKFIKKETKNNFSFEVVDIKYRAFGTGTHNYGITHTALLIYDKVTKEERQKVIDAYASAYLGKPCEGICDACDDTDCQNTPDEEAEPYGD